MLNEASLRELIDAPLHYYPSVKSTNDHARELARHGAAGGTLVVAETQTAGRGRKGKSWASPRGESVSMSVVLRPIDLDSRTLGAIGLAGALAVVDALSQHEIHARVKWPNDVLVEGRKTGGVLAEALWTGVELRAVVVGIGVNTGPIETDGEPDFPLTWVSVPDSNLLVAGIYGALAQRLDSITRGSAHPEWERDLAYLGERVQVERDGERLTGRLAGLSPFGGLRLLADGDKEVVLEAGEHSLRLVE